MDRHSKLAIFFTITALTLTSQPALAGDVTVLPTLSGSESWTDNALSTSNTRKADFVTTVEPSVIVDGKGERLNFGVNYDVAYDAYADQTQLNGFRQNGFGDVRAELVPDWLFLDARGNMSEQTIAPVGVVTAGDRTAASNLVQVGSWSVTPSLLHRIGSTALVEASYRHDQLAYLTGLDVAQIQPGQTVADSVGDGGHVKIRSGEDFTNLLWGYTADADRVSRAALVFTHVANTGQSELRIADGFGLLAHLGYDHVDDQQINSAKYSGVFYGAGFHWAPASDADLRLEVGRRYDGIDISALGTYHVGAFTALKVQQRSGLETEDETFANALDLIQRDPAGHYIDPFSSLAAAPSASPFTRSSSVFKIRRTDIAVNYAREENTAVLAGGLITRTDLSDDGSLGGVGSQTSAFTLSVSLAHAVNESVSAGVTLGGEDVYGGTLPVDKGRTGRMGLDVVYLIDPTATVRVSYHYVDTHPDQGDPVHENMLTLGARKTF